MSVMKFFLLFYSKSYLMHLGCISATTSDLDDENKTASYTKTYYNSSSRKYENVTFQIRALNQTDYMLENVMREGANGSMPEKTPIPLGSYTYVEYDDYYCYSTSTLYWDVATQRGKMIPVQKLTPKWEENVKLTYDDIYVVYGQPSCMVVRNLGFGGACELWVNETRLRIVLEAAEKEREIAKAAREKEKKDTKSDSRCNKDCQAHKEYLKRLFEWRAFEKAVFKRCPIACRLAFLVACGRPQYLKYDKKLCNKTQTEETGNTASN